jgi:hypothetical protein
VELSSGLANTVETLLLQWIADPSEQARQVDAILHGAGVKWITTLSSSANAGERSVAENLGKPVMTVPLGANPTTWPPTKRIIGDRLTYYAYVSPDSKSCDVQCVFDRVRESDGAWKLERLFTTTTFRALNGLPVLLARRDFGSVAELVIAKATWGLPPTTRPVAGNAMPMRVYVRARVVAVSPAFAHEADKVKDNPKALADWLKRRGTTQATIGITTNSGVQADFTHCFEEEFLQPDNSGLWYNIGTEIEVVPVIESDGNTMDLTATVKSYQLEDTGRLLKGLTTGRYLHSNPTGISLENPDHAQRPKTLTIAAGESAAIPCYEYKDLPSKEVPNALHKDVAVNDVFIVFDRILSDNVGSGPHFYDTN